MGWVDGVVVSHAICALHDSGVGVHDGLHFGGGVGQGAGDVRIGQGAVDHGHRGLDCAAKASDAQGAVVGLYGGGVRDQVRTIVLGVSGDLGQSRNVFGRA